MYDFSNLGDAFNNTLDDIMGGLFGDDGENIVVEAESLITEETNNSTQVKEFQDAKGSTVDEKVGTNLGIPIIYGTRRTGGILIYQETSTPFHGVLYQTYALAEGIQQQWTIYLDNVALANSRYWRDTGDGKGNGVADRMVYANFYGDGGSWAWGSGTGTDAGIPDPDYSAGDSWDAGNNAIYHKCKGFAAEQLIFLYQIYLSCNFKFVCSVIAIINFITVKLL